MIIIYKIITIGRQNLYYGKSYFYMNSLKIVILRKLVIVSACAVYTLSNRKRSNKRRQKIKRL